MTNRNLPDSVTGSMVSPVRVVSDENGEKRLAASFVFGLDFPGFDGHFPGNPIVPGIVQIMAAALVAGSAVQGSLGGVKRCKFLRPVKPGERIDVELACSQNGQCSATLVVEGSECASIQFFLGA